MDLRIYKLLTKDEIWIYFIMLILIWIKGLPGE